MQLPCAVRWDADIHKRLAARGPIPKYFRADFHVPAGGRTTEVLNAAHFSGTRAVNSWCNESIMNASR
jgi:hypothetical protein